VVGGVLPSDMFVFLRGEDFKSNLFVVAMFILCLCNTQRTQLCKGRDGNSINVGEGWGGVMGESVRGRLVPHLRGPKSKLKIQTLPEHFQ
jgi:hypothetical protein